jgi:hypothetical protein
MEFSIAFVDEMPGKRGRPMKPEMAQIKEALPKMRVGQKVCCGPFADSHTTWCASKNVYQIAGRLGLKIKVASLDNCVYIERIR